MQNDKLKIKKRVFIIHGWDGYPEEGWFPWLKEELGKKGFQVHIPAMPNPTEPKIDEWVGYLLTIAGEADKNTYFIGHSIGCQTILRYLESLPKNKKVGGAVFVAGWFKLANLTEEEQKIAEPWVKTPINFDKVKQHCKKFVAIFSDNDNWVSLDNKEIFEKRLGAKTIIEHQKGHFSGSDNITMLSSALEALLNF